MSLLRPTTRWLLLALGLVVIGTAAQFVWWGKYSFDECQHMSLWHRLIAIGLQNSGTLVFQSQSCQDRWVVLEVFPRERKGYFVDVGSGDGVIFSNSKALEDLGWKGVCVDPFPTNMASRRCKLFTNPVDSVGGKRVRFRRAGDLGGIDDYLGRWKEKAQTVPVIVELETRTLTQLLDEAKAPPYIHYMSIDIEGAELEALKGLDFSRYRFGAMTIEHNFEEPKRSEIRKLLERNGYRYVSTSDMDDFFVGAGGR